MGLSDNMRVFSCLADVKKLNRSGTNFSKDIRRPPPPSTPQEVPMWFCYKGFDCGFRFVGAKQYVIVSNMIFIVTFIYGECRLNIIYFFT